MVVAAALLLTAAGCGDEGGAGDGGATRAGAVAEAGCLACHRVTGDGNAEPGGDLSRIGARLDPGALRGKLLDPPDGMPSYSGLPRGKLDAIVRELQALR